jgi:hypothetical protein
MPVVAVGLVVGVVGDAATVAAAVAVAVGLLKVDLLGLQHQSDPPRGAGRGLEGALGCLDRKLRHGSQCTGGEGSDQPIFGRCAMLQIGPNTTVSDWSFNAGHLAEVSRCLDNPD